jgi:23S rRNA (uracil1939-C5)-methyltransferase
VILAEGGYVSRLLSEVITIERLIPGGDGFGRLADGCPVFVSGAFPGDEVAVLELDRRPGYARATSFRLEKPSALRVRAECPVADACGGCDWMTLELGAQRAGKLEILRDALRRTGGFQELPFEIRSVVGPSTQYRSRVRVRVREGKLGFFAKGSHQLVQFESCLVATPAVNRALDKLREYVALRPGDFEQFDEAEVRALPGEERPTLCLWLGEKRRGLTSASRRMLEGMKDDFIVGVKRSTRQGERVVVRAEEHHHLSVSGGIRLRLGPFDFSQVNLEINQRIVDELVQGAGQRHARSFLDLYCGAGNFSLPLRRAGIWGVGIESNPSAIVHAQAALDEQLSGADAPSITAKTPPFIAGHVAPQTKLLLEAKQVFDLVVLDPPRSGAKEVIESVAKLARKWVFVCACDPVTFARDLKLLVSKGFELEQVTAYDMFPQTHHVEATAWLRKRG